MADASDTGAGYASRKFVLAAVVVIEAGAFLALHIIDPATWATLTGGALTAYCAANVLQKATS